MQVNNQQCTGGSGTGQYDIGVHLLEKYYKNSQNRKCGQYVINMAVYGASVPDRNDNAARAVRIKNKIGYKNQAALLIALICSNIKQTFCKKIGQYQQCIDSPRNSA